MKSRTFGVKLQKGKLTKRIFSVFLKINMILLFASSSLLAQDNVAERNYNPGVPYSVSDIEMINETNGNLMFNFDFGQVNGRGTAAAGFSLKYNSKLYESHQMNTLDSSGQPADQLFLRASQEGGWKYEDGYRIRVISRNDEMDSPLQIGGDCNPPNYDAVYLWKVVMYFPDGSQHEFRPTGYSDTIQNSGGTTIYNGNGFFNISTNGTIRN
ncbi:MAG: hypothetical protein ACK5NT_02225 [Pyrinomonadaceae bacterium]